MCTIICSPILHIKYQNMIPVTPYELQHLKQTGMIDLKRRKYTDTTGYFSLVITEESITTPAWLGEYAARLKGYFSLV